MPVRDARHLYRTLLHVAPALVACAAAAAAVSAPPPAAAQRAPRAPVATAHARGSFLNAANDKASELNERRATIIATATSGEIAVVQIAGLIARRIVSFVREGDSVGTGQRIGLIRFGSRVDVYLPPACGALVAPGQRAVGGETVFADLKSQEGEREARLQ